MKIFKFFSIPEFFSKKFFEVPKFSEIFFHCKEKS